jgi:hypothetical protein
VPVTAHVEPIHAGVLRLVKAEIPNLQEFPLPGDRGWPQSVVDRSAAGSDGAAFSAPSASRSDSFGSPAALRALISLRLAALSLWRSNRRISFWRLLKVSIIFSSFASRTLNAAAVVDGRPRALKDCLPARLAPLTTETAAVSATAAVRRLGAGFIDVQCAAFEIHAVQAGDSPVGFFGVAHFDKRKAAGAAGITIRNQVDTVNCSIPLEYGTNRGIGSGKIQVVVSIFSCLKNEVARLRSSALRCPSVRERRLLWI